MKKYIYLFRHGQTYYNKNGWFTGWKNSRLTPLGIKQAKIIAKKLKTKKFQIAIKTSLLRSGETLKYVLKYHPECKKIIIDDRMIERSYGDLEGTSHKKFIEKYGKEKYNIVHRSWDIPPSHGESFKMVEKRVKSFIKWIKKYIKKNKVNVAISAHGNSIRLFRKIWEKKSIEETVKWFIPYDKVFIYSVEV